eukprot:3995199-Pleurochrysis_carterae.AAC.1
MSLPAGMPSGCVSLGAAGRALPGLEEAVRAAERACHTMATLEISIQPQAVDFKALDFQGWKRWATLAIFKGRDGVVRFTDGRSPVLHRPADDGVDVALYATALGGS